MQYFLVYEYIRDFMVFDAINRTNKISSNSDASYVCFVPTPLRKT